MSASSVIRVAAAEIAEIVWLDTADPGDIPLAPLTQQLRRVSHCGSRTPAADS